MIGNKLQFARKSARTSEVEVNAVENAKEVTVFDPSLQKDRRGELQIRLAKLKLLFCTCMDCNVLVYLSSTVIGLF
jgi:hypothetical protein